MLVLFNILFLFYLQNELLHSKAQVLSRSVWDILTILPTSPSMLERFRHFPTRELKEECQAWLKKDLDPSNLQKLMYSLYIIESLVQMGIDKNSDEDEILLEVDFYYKNFYIFYNVNILILQLIYVKIFLDINKWFI